MSTTAKLSNDDKVEKRREYQRQYKKTNRKKLSALENARYHEDTSGQRNRHLKSKYGITADQWDALFAAQGSSCAICHTTDKPTRGWNTDHCHTTNVVRGILCNHCNVMLGYARDNPSTLAAGIAYLKAHNGT